MIELYSHNQTAYEAVLAQLNETGKAAVIHPTGTGKSFIALKLVEDNPSARFCWLSPSECIFQTRLENVRKIVGFELENLRCMENMRRVNKESGNIWIYFCAIQTTNRLNAHFRHSKG